MQALSDRHESVIWDTWHVHHPETTMADHVRLHQSLVDETGSWYVTNHVHQLVETETLGL